MIRKSILFLLTLCFIVGCSSQSVWMSPAFVAGAAIDTSALRAVTATSLPVTTPSPALANSQTLTLWVPPQFDSASDTAAGRTLKARLNAFMIANPDIKVQVRVKALSGPAGLLESLSVTQPAAPQALPSMVALPRSALEVAAIKGLVLPWSEQALPLVEGEDFYTFARQLAKVQNQLYGLPFAGEALVLVYRPAQITIPNEWAALLRQTQPVLFPAADPQAFLTLALYQAMGGKVEDGQNRPIIQADALRYVLKLYADGAQQGIFPTWITNYQTDQQAWRAYREGTVHALITWSSFYLSELPADSLAIPLPIVTGQGPYTYAGGWAWALSEPAPERRALCMRLATFLMDSNFLAEWTENAGYIPPRPDALSKWSNQSIRTLLTRVAMSAQVSPPNEIVSSLGPVLNEVVQQVIKRQMDASQAVEKVTERLAIPQER